MSFFSKTKEEAPSQTLLLCLLCDWRFFSFLSVVPTCSKSDLSVVPTVGLVAFPSFPPCCCCCRFVGALVVNIVEAPSSSSSSFLLLFFFFSSSFLLLLLPPPAETATAVCFFLFLFLLQLLLLLVDSGSILAGKKKPTPWTSWLGGLMCKVPHGRSAGAGPGSTCWIGQQLSGQTWCILVLCLRSPLYQRGFA